MSGSLVTDPAVEKLRSLVARAREQLSDAQSEYMREKVRVVAMQAELFHLLRSEYLRRDAVRVRIASLQAQLAALERGNRAEAAAVEHRYEDERERVQREYEAAASELTGRHKLEPEQKVEIGRLWKKLVKLYHPDRYTHEPARLETYHKLTTAINKAKEAGDMTTLREISDDPQAFIARQGWTELDLTDELEFVQLQRLHTALLAEITSVLDSLACLRASQEFQLCQRCDMHPGGLPAIAASLTARLATECEALEVEAEALHTEIARAGRQQSALGH